MKDRYYSELISQEFYKKISDLRIEKDIKCFEQFEFIFVNSNECKCQNVPEKLLKIIKTSEDTLTNMTNIIVLGYGTWKNFSYTNEKYTFIGIFDMNGNESTIDLGSIELNSFEIRQDLYFQAIDITSCNITISWIHFREYLVRVITPIHNAICSSLDESFGRGFGLDIKLTMDINPFIHGNCPVRNFQSTLNHLKSFEQTLNHNFENTKFDPEITIKQEITFKIKSSEIQF